MTARILTVFMIGMALVFSLNGENKRLVTANDMHVFKQVGNPVISPDGKKVAYTVSYYCEKKEKRFGDIYVMDINGKQTKRLTTHPAIERGITWSPDSKRIAFSARRDGKKSQIFIIKLGGGEALQLTSHKTGAVSPLWSPDGKWIAFYSTLGKMYTEKMQKELGDVRYITRLRYYHVRSWDKGNRRRIFVIPADGSGKASRLTSGECADEGDHSMCWAPDSKEIAFVSNRDPEWWNSIDTNIYTVSVPQGITKMITTNRGPDHSPRYSPDGKYLGFRSIFTYNYESENYKVVVWKRNGSEKNRPLTSQLDLSVRNFRWGPRGKTIYFLYGSEGRYLIKAVSLKSGKFTEVLNGRHVVNGWDLSKDGKTIILRRSDDTHQAELYLLGKRLQQITHVNDRIMAQFHVQPAEEIWYKSTDNHKVQGWIIKPVGFQESKKYPMILSIHGGPHGMSTISYRFQFQLLAASGYVVLYTNPRASLGYGETFSRQIWQDWGGLCYQDIMSGVDHVIKLGYVDKTKIGVTGGSFGGYMTNWIVGQTNRFGAAVTVAGLSNLTSFYGTTDEQFFPEAEFKGTPWDQRELYLKHSPIWYAGNFKTPTMIIHGQYDFRVRTEQAEQMFAALQKQKVPSVYAWFPNEGHGVRRPKHRRLYYKIILDWFDHFLLGKPSKYLEMAADKPYAADNSK